MQYHLNRHKLHILLSISISLSILGVIDLFRLTSVRRHLFLSCKSKFSINEDFADRSLIFIRTSLNCQTRLKYLLQSWIPSDPSKQKNIFLITDRRSSDLEPTAFDQFQNVFETNCSGTHARFDLCCKTANEFELFYHLSMKNSKIDWLCRFDDDQYVNLNNLHQFLSTLNASEFHYIGRTSIDGQLKSGRYNRSFVFATYGAGVCFSRPLLEKIRSEVRKDVFPQNCMKHGIADDAHVGFIVEILFNHSLSSRRDLFHSHLEKLDQSFRKFSLNDLTQSISFGFAWDRYKLNWLPVIHHLVQLTNENQTKAAFFLWTFLRNYERDHPEDLSLEFDRSCTSYQKRRQDIQSVKPH